MLPQAAACTVRSLLLRMSLLLSSESLRLVFAVPQAAAAVVAPQWRQLGVAVARPVAAVELLPPLGVDALGLLFAVELLLLRWTVRLPIAVQL